MKFTFGIITNSIVDYRIIESIENQNIDDYEIIIVGGDSNYELNVKHISFEESSGNYTVKKNMITLPLIHSYSTLTKSESRQVKKILNLKKKSQKEITVLKELVHASGGFEYASQKIDEFSNQAIDILDEYPDSPYKQSLADLVIFNSRRNY